MSKYINEPLVKFGSPVTSVAFPSDAICHWVDSETDFGFDWECGHRFDQHDDEKRHANDDGIGYACGGSGEDIDDACCCPQFTPVRLAGGTYSPREEQTLYEMAMRGAA
jgi:hypothetical protein